MKDEEKVLLYEGLIEKFLKKKITPIEFETEYFDYCDRIGMIGGDFYKPLQWLFSELDSYFEAGRFGLTEEDFDPEYDIYEEQLRKSAKEVLVKIKELE